MNEYDDLVKQFWKTRNGIFRFRKWLIVQCIAGIGSQILAVSLLSDTPYFFGLVLFGTIIFISGAFFLNRNNKHVEEINKQGDRLFYRDPNWREKNGRTVY